jgi:hypothetical protein
VLTPAFGFGAPDVALGHLVGLVLAGHAAGEGVDAPALGAAVVERAVEVMVVGSRHGLGLLVGVEWVTKKG